MDAPTPISQSKHDRYIVAHAVLGSVAALITLPAALLVGRYLRSWRHWNVLHLVLNFGTLALVVITFALGNAALKDPNQYFGPHSDAHHKLGLAVLLIIVVQAIFGIAARLTKIPPHNYVTIQAKRNPLRILHILFGIATAGILYAQIYTGFQEWDDTSDSGTTTPQGIRTAFWVLFALEVFLYLIGWPVMEVLARRKRRQEPEEVQEKTAAAHTGRPSESSTAGLVSA